MSTRATWKGVLRISRVTIPIKVFPATEASESLAFHQLHATCQARMQQKRWCPTCAREVPTAEIVKGFEFAKGQYVVLLEEELDAVKPPSARVIDLVAFADDSGREVDPMFIDRSYYLVPDGEGAREAFAVMRVGMTGKVGIGKVAIYGREYLVAVRPQREVFVLHTLHQAAGIRRAAAAVGDLLSDGTAAPSDQVRLARRVIAALEGPLHLGDFTDQCRADLQRLIEAKIAGHEIVEPAIADRAPILPLRAALAQSLDLVRAAKKTPVKVARAGAATRPRAETRRCS